jgi:hypothetical protein
MDKQEKRKSIGSPLIGKGRLSSFLKDRLLKELGNYLA